MYLNKSDREPGNAKNENFKQRLPKPTAFIFKLS